MGRGGQELGGSSQTESRTHVLFFFHFERKQTESEDQADTPSCQGPGPRWAGVQTTRSCSGPQATGLPLTGRRLLFYQHYEQPDSLPWLEDRKLSGNGTSETHLYFRRRQTQWTVSVPWHPEADRRKCRSAHLQALRTASQTGHTHSPTHTLACVFPGDAGRWDGRRMRGAWAGAHTHRQGRSALPHTARRLRLNRPKLEYSLGTC